MADHDAGFGDERADLIGEAIDAADAIVDEIDLPAALDLVEDRLTDDGGVPLGDVGLDGLAALGGSASRSE